ncbi:G1/S-specific cyclin E [Plasmopara halstedii]|uniref:G1/S-specific cyclin E n=1 Tax=Plasmopara halstedii TaxID=4781 RepID=A0A0P1AFZ2_PLAHL|nr:G1/S-specific cyclin E [Plasmopara halstedii]CEG39357.1 G1/S-specific cyclin E [Plasmopara halstedii]|eukprot:XP_024575726.1 G1/S-specific cyclin E [Plasmopara halstedii]
MNPDLMTVLSMRQKEMSYHQLALPGRLSPAISNDFGANLPLKSSDMHDQDSGFSLQTSNFEQFGFTWHWIIEVATHFALQRQTAHFANQYAQVLLRRRVAFSKKSYTIGFRDDVRYMQRQLRVLGLSCVFMAAKIEEVHPPKAAELVAFLAKRGAVKLAAEDLARLEVDYVVELQWNLHPTTPYAWLLFMVAGGSADQRPLDTMGDFVNPSRNLSGTKELFVNAIRLVDIALLDFQAIEYWPSVLAGAALLLVDPALDFMFVAQFLQLDPNVLWECKSWLYAMAFGVCDLEALSTQAKDRWVKVPVEELLFIQSQVVVPSHLACGLLRPDSLVDLCSAGLHTPLGKGYGLDTCQSPCSPSNNYAMVAPPSNCICKSGYHTCGGETPGPHVYHFKYGWQGIETGLITEPTLGYQQEHYMQYP